MHAKFRTRSTRACIPKNPGGIGWTERVLEQWDDLNKCWFQIASKKNWFVKGDRK